MIIYLFVFGLSILFVFYAESKKFIGLSAQISIAIALIIPCLLAGARDRTIGTDIAVYVEPLFLAAQKVDSLWEYMMFSTLKENMWEYLVVSSFETGYILLVYFVAKVFHSLPVLLFFTQMLVILPVYGGLRNFSDKQPVWFGMTVFYLMFYNQTFNMMRQWIAMAILFYGFYYLVTGKNKKYFLAVVCAMMFHNSAIIGVLNYLVYQLVAKEHALNRGLKLFALLILGVVAVFSLDYIAQIIELLGLRYGFYISGSLSFLPNQIVYRLPILCLFLIRWRYIKKYDRLAPYYLVMIFYDFLCSQLASIFEQSGRIGLYFSEYYMLAYPAICTASSKRNNRRVMRMAVLCFLCVYWWFVYVYQGVSETVPYVSSIEWAW